MTDIAESLTDWEQPMHPDSVTRSPSAVSWIPAVPTALDKLGSDPFLSAIVRSSNDAIIGKTTEGTVVFWNEAAEHLYGYEATEMIGNDIAILFPPDRRGELADILARVQQGESVRHFATERVRKDGTTVDVSITVAPVLDTDGSVLGISTIAHDLTLYNWQISDLREAHRRADETLSTLETLHGSAPVGLGFVDREFHIVHLNEVLAGVNGSTVSEQIGKSLAEVIPEIWPQIEPLYVGVLENDEPVLNVEVSGETAADPGHLHHWLASYYPVHLDTEIIGVGIVVIDVTERRMAEGFRSSVMDNMAEGLITVDTLGRLTSLNESASRMLGWTEDELLDRVMSEVILPRGEDGTSIREDAKEILRVRVEGITIRLDDTEYLCKNGSSLPVALSASPLLSGTTVEGAVVVFRDITEERSERLRIERELAALTWVGRIREALDEDRLVLYAQPIVPLRGGRPSEELLLRMVDRDGTVIGPNAFLGVAEKYGLITEIDQFVVKQGVRLAAMGRHVGVNLSAESIVTPGLLSIIEHEIQHVGIDPANLMFEITETALMRDMEKAYGFACAIVALGCSIALDDFGTGFGTFSHVKKLPVKILKIDIEFVKGLVASSANQHVVKAIVNLAQGFGCETIAEGVEDAETLQLLEEYGVDYAQGYYLGRPAPL
jgi:PAS domain S-box-containing protein